MASQAREETDAGEQGVHRLRDILVEEVSLVDRAANKRRFLIVKRAKMASDADDNGESETERGKRRKRQRAEGAAAAGESEKRRGRQQEEDEPEEAGKARRGGGQDDDEPDETEKAQRRRTTEGDDPDETEKARRQHAGDDERDDAEKARRAAAGGDVEDEDEDEDEEAEEEEQEEEDDARRSAESRKARRTRSGGSGGGDTEDEEDARGGSGAKGAARRSTGGGDSKKPPWLKKVDRSDVLKLLTAGLDRLVKLATQVKDSTGALPDEVGREAAAIAEIIQTVGSCPATPGAVAKAGARMAKDRLERFNKAIELLSSILKELTATRQEPPSPTAGAAQAGVNKGGSQPAGVAEVVASLGELTAIVKRQGDELARLRQTPSASNALSVDGARRSQPEEVAWPMDMNRPIRRDQVNKELSFYDE